MSNSWLAGVWTAMDRFVPSGRIEERQRARHLVLVCFLMVVITVAFATMHLTVYRSPLNAAVLLAAGALALPLPALLRRTGSLETAGNAAAAVAFAALVGLSLLRGGFPVSVLVWLCLIPTGTALLSLRPRVVLFWAALCLLAIGALYALYELGVSPGLAQIGETPAPATSGLLSLVGLIAFMTLLSRPLANARRALGRERDEMESRLLQAQRLDCLGQLAGGIAHDFGNVLTSITVSAQYARSRISDSETGRADIQLILDSVAQGSALIEQLMTFARNEVTEPTLLDVNASVQRMKTLLQRVLGRDIEIVTALEPELWAVSMDPRQLDRVLLNLAINAKDAMPAGGTLSFATANVHVQSEPNGTSALDLLPGTYVRLDVRDTGCGMSPEIAARIFEPFFTTKTGGVGTGLGLSTCYGVITQMGGTLSVASQPEQGSTFRIHLPTVHETRPLLSGDPLPTPPPN